MTLWQEDFARLAVPTHGLTPVAQHLGLTRNQLRAWTWKHRVRSGVPMRSSCEKIADPTETEIEQRAAEVRREWDDAEFYKRAGVVMAEIECEVVASVLYR